MGVKISVLFRRTHCRKSYSVGNNVWMIHMYTRANHTVTCQVFWIGIDTATFNFFFLKAYVTCSLGEKYVGYSMIVMGAANVLGAVVVALCAKHIPREVVFGIGGIIHMGIMIGFLIWIPDKTKHIHFILAASWGVCDAVWQTQCNSKFISLKCKKY